MFPGEAPLITFTNEFSDFKYPRNLHYPITESYELGGIALSNVSRDLDSFVWKAWTDGSTIYLNRIDTDVVIEVLDDINIKELDLTFDQNMKICIVYTSEDITKMYWYDTFEGKQVTTVYPPEVQRPRVSLDDKRRFNISNSDIIFVYQREGFLCYRVQRDKYLIEYIIDHQSEYRFLWRIGMGNDRRFLIHWR